MHAFPRPQQPLLYVDREPAGGSCPECGAAELAEYRVLSEGGWWQVRKCQRCLCSVSRTRAAPFGSYTPLTLG